MGYYRETERLYRAPLHLDTSLIEIQQEPDQAHVRGPRQKAVIISQSSRTTEGPLIV